VILVNRTFYLLTLFFFVLAVSTGVCVVLKEFNRMVCPAAPVRAFNLEAGGSQTCRIEFLLEESELKLPVDLNRAGDLMKQYQRDLVEGKCLATVAKAGKVTAGWCSTLREAGNRFVSDLLSRSAAAAGSFQERLHTRKAGER
jgi:hypothetical protein